MQKWCLTWAGVRQEAIVALAPGDGVAVHRRSPFRESDPRTLADASNHASTYGKLRRNCSEVELLKKCPYFWPGRRDFERCVFSSNGDRDLVGWCGQIDQDVVPLRIQKPVANCTLNTVVTSGQGKHQLSVGVKLQFDLIKVVSGLAEKLARSARAKGQAEVAVYSSGRFCGHQGVWYHCERRPVVKEPFGMLLVRKIGWYRSRKNQQQPKKQRQPHVTCKWGKLC